MTAPPPQLCALPCWQGPITATPLSGGLSNESWKVTDAAGQHVARFGPDLPFHHVDRLREVVAARAAHAAGFAPDVEYAGPGIMVSAFVSARTWGAADMRAQPERVADLLARFHRDMPAHVSGTAFILWPFHVIRDYARTLAAENSPFLPEVPPLMALAEAFEAAQVPLPIVYGHHDMLPANILEDDTRLWLIDFEYSGFGIALFDLAFAAALSDMTEPEAARLLEAYFDRSPDAALVRAYDAMQGAALIREVMWSMVSARFMAAPGADYTAYARLNQDRLTALVARYEDRHGPIRGAAGRP